jgi:hypothetical protein
LLPARSGPSEGATSCTGSPRALPCSKTKVKWHPCLRQEIAARSSRRDASSSDPALRWCTLESTRPYPRSSMATSTQSFWRS